MSAQPDLFAAAADEEKRVRSLADQRAYVADDERDADILAGMLTELHDALGTLCPACAAAVDEVLAEAPLL